MRGAFRIPKTLLDGADAADPLQNPQLFADTVGRHENRDRPANGFCGRVAEDASLYQLLTPDGRSLLTADKGQQALDLLDRSIRPSLIMVDLMLPRASGFDLITYLRTEADLRTIPTVVITALPKDEVRVIADVVFHKPLAFDPLMTTIRTLLRTH